MKLSAPPDAGLSPRRARRLLDLCVALNTVQDPGVLLQSIIQTATDILDCEAASLLLFDEATGRLRFEAATGEQAEALTDILVPLDNSIAGMIFRENRPIVVDQAEDDLRHFKGAEDATGLRTEALLGVPMRIGDVPIGVLEVLNPHRGYFDETDTETLLIVSAQAAVAIRNARQLRALREAHERLQRLDEVKSEFMAVASHELRTPVSIVLGFGGVLQDESTGHLADMAAEVITAGERMQEIIETVEEMAALQNRTAELDRHPLLLQDVVREAWTEAEVEVYQTEAHLDLAAEPLWVRADRRRLHLAVLNLLKNAVAFTPDTGRVTLALEADSVNARITVRDTGCGFAEGDQARIFDAFYQVESHLTRSHEGLGVGLTVARAIARLHGGSLRAESAGSDRGSAFQLRIPRYLG